MLSYDTFMLFEIHTVFVCVFLRVRQMKSVRGFRINAKEKISNKFSGKNGKQTFIIFDLNSNLVFY